MVSSDTTMLIVPDADEDTAAGPSPSSLPPPLYSEVDECKPDDNAPSNLAMVQDELPPPYTPNAVTLFINCRVCQVPISMEGRQHLHVIKCTACNEATPIKTAPPGKKYIRCPCNCLLICNVLARRVACPRENCRRMIALQMAVGNGMQTAVATAAGQTIRANCGHCNEVFVVLRSTIRTRLTRCPHCTLTSSVGYGFIRRKALLFGILGAVFLLLGVITTVVSVLTASGVGVYVVWIGAYLVGALNLLRSMIYCCIKVSHPINE